MSLEVIISLSSLFFAILVAIFGDNWLSFLDRTNVRYVKTHILLHGNERIYGFILINSGNKIPKDIVIKVEFENSNITDIQLEDNSYIKQPTIEKDVLNAKFVIIHYERLMPKSRTGIYISANGAKELPKVYGTFDDRSIQEENYIYKRPVSDRVAIFLGLFALAWMLLGIVFP